MLLIYYCDFDLALDNLALILSLFFLVGGGG